MKIVVGQINSKIADFSGNSQKMLNVISRAARDGADMVLFPELSLCGYPPLDLLTYHNFISENNRALARLCEQIPPGIAVVLGSVGERTSKVGKPLQNEAVVLVNGKIAHRQAKTLLPTYDVFDEDRYFEPAKSRIPFSYKGLNCGIVVCEDIWLRGSGTFIYAADPVGDQVRQGANLLIVLSASPYHIGKIEERINIIKELSETHGIPVIFVNAVGANDSLIFDGTSMVFWPGTGITVMASSFTEDYLICELADMPKQPAVSYHEDVYGDLEQALVLGLTDYMEKTGFSHVNIGLSGGIDSSLVSVLAVKALGPDRVHAYAMPSRFSTFHSLEDSRVLAKRLGIGYEEISIEPIFSVMLESLTTSLGDGPFGVTEENIQARIRGMMLMAWSNKKGSLLLTTGNKSELAVGYCTLYGDMCGSLSLIGDLMKTEVFSLCRHINQQAGDDLIPERVLTKPPSAELRHDQRDDDSLPPYDVLDSILRLYLIQCASAEEIVDAGYDQETVHNVIRLVELSEYKRRQAAMVLKVSAKAFGQGRRMPIAKSLYEVESIKPTQ